MVGVVCSTVFGVNGACWSLVFSVFVFGVMSVSELNAECKATAKLEADSTGQVCEVDGAPGRIGVVNELSLELCAYIVEADCDDIVE